MAGLQGLGGDGSPNIDALGIFFIVFTILWNLFVFGGLLWLYRIRDSVAVRIRNYWLLASAVVTLSLYEICVLVRYPMNATFKCAAEFWVMSTILPLSIALFQGIQFKGSSGTRTERQLTFHAASNIQLLSYYDEQQHVASLAFRRREKRVLKLTTQGIHRHWNQLTTVQRVCVGIMIGMILQVIESQCLPVQFMLSLTDDCNVHHLFRIQNLSPWLWLLWSIQQSGEMPSNA